MDIPHCSPLSHHHPLEHNSHSPSNMLSRPYTPVHTLTHGGDDARQQTLSNGLLDLMLKEDIQILQSVFPTVNLLETSEEVCLNHQRFLRAWISLLFAIHKIYKYVQRVGCFLSKNIFSLCISVKKSEPILR